MANITVTAQVANGEATYWARMTYQVAPIGREKFSLTPTSCEVLCEVDSEALTKSLAISPVPPPPDNVKNHLELEKIIWKTENIKDESKISLTSEGAKEVKAYILAKSSEIFNKPIHYRFASPN